MHEVSTKYWKEDPVFAPYYHNTGIIFSAATPEVFEHVKTWIVGNEAEYEKLEGAADFQKTMPKGVLTGDFPGWQGFWKRNGAGWLFARGALMSAYHEAVKLSINFVTDERQGKVTELLYSSDSGRVLGAKTADGSLHHADWVILTAGASADTFFDFEDQLRPTAWTLAHIPLTESENALFKDLPVLYNPERGFFIEPDAENHELKFCDEHPGYINLERDVGPGHDGQQHSVPFARHQIPLESEERMRRFLRDTMPQLAEREFSFARVCWDSDTVDRQFLIDRHPKWRNLVVAAGGSGMGFMLSPCVGQLIADTLEESIEHRLRKGLRWRPEQAEGRDWWASEYTPWGVGYGMANVLPSSRSVRW